MEDKLYDALDATRLQGTSQGKKTDLPPMKWIRKELKQFGTIDTPPIYKADLGNQHPFRREAFNELDDDRYAALEQSFRLAARLLNTARPYICNFFPVQLVQYRRRGWLSEARLPIVSNHTIEERAESITQFMQMLKYVHWVEDEGMLKQYNILGLTHTGLSDGVWQIFAEMGGEESEDVWALASEEADEAGLPYRSLTIALASEMIDAIISSEPNTEQHMNAVFQAGITIAHELGHAMFYCHKEQKVFSFWVGDDILNETGHSLIAWLFGGFYPEPIYLENNKSFREFRAGHEWTKMPRKPLGQPLATVRYSMPMAHIQRILSEKSWAKYDWNDPNVHIRIKEELLSPHAPFKIGKHARVSRIFGSHSQWKLIPQYAGLEEQDAEEDDEDEGDTSEAFTRKAKGFVDEDWDDRENATEEAAKEEAANKRKRIPDLTGDTDYTSSVPGGSPLSAYGSRNQSGRNVRRKTHSSGNYLEIDEALEGDDLMTLPAKTSIESAGESDSDPLPKPELRNFARRMISGMLAREREAKAATGTKGRNAPHQEGTAESDRLVKAATGHRREGTNTATGPQLPSTTTGTRPRAAAASDSFWDDPKLPRQSAIIGERIQARLREGPKEENRRRIPQYDEYEIEEFLTHNPRFRPNPRDKNTSSKPRYTNEQIDAWFRKKFGADLDPKQEKLQAAAAIWDDDGEDENEYEDEDEEEYDDEGEEGDTPTLESMLFD